MSQRHDSDILPSEITPESIYLARRKLLRAGLATPLVALAGCGSRDADAGGPPAVASPAKDSPDGFRTSEVQTRFEDASSYNNFYEFGTGKADPAKYAGSLRPSPWIVEIAGEAELTGRFHLEHLIKDVRAQERIYRMRCVEGWSMVIPWLGVPLGEILRKFKPTSRAKYVAFTSLADPRQMPGVLYGVLDWPYREGLRIDEAMHPLTLLATGMYGKTLPNQNGAPLRLVVPWKYGFKGIKSIVKIEFTQKMPATAWNVSAPEEYGFYSNVNPAVDHPRWSQKTERRISGSASKLFAERIETRPFNGYASQVASLYSGMDLRKWF